MGCDCSTMPYRPITAVPKEGTTLAEVMIPHLRNAHDVAGSSPEIQVPNPPPNWQGFTPVAIVPLAAASRCCCCPLCWMSVPQGFGAIVSSWGADVAGSEPDATWSPGFHWYCCWHSVNRLVSRQRIVFDTPVRDCKTKDNITVNIDALIVLEILEAYDFIYQLGPEKLDSLLRASQEEVLRQVVYTTTIENIYDLHGIATDAIHVAMSMTLDGVDYDEALVNLVLQQGSSGLSAISPEAAPDDGGMRVANDEELKRKKKKEEEFKDRIIDQVKQHIAEEVSVDPKDVEVKLSSSSGKIKIYMKIKNSGGTLQVQSKLRYSSTLASNLVERVRRCAQTIDVRKLPLPEIENIGVSNFSEPVIQATHVAMSMKLDGVDYDSLRADEATLTEKEKKERDQEKEKLIAELRKEVTQHIADEAGVLPKDVEVTLSLESGEIDTKIKYSLESVHSKLMDNFVVRDQGDKPNKLKAVKLKDSSTLASNLVERVKNLTGIEEHAKGDIRIPDDNFSAPVPEGWVQYMNELFEPYGVKIHHFTVRNVTIPKAMAQDFEDKTLFESKTKEKEVMHKFQLLDLKNEEAKQEQKQSCENQRMAEEQKAVTNKAQIVKEVREVLASTDKEIAIKEAVMRAEVEKIKAEADFQVAETKAEIEKLEREEKSKVGAEVGIYDSKAEAYQKEKEALGRKKAQEQIAIGKIKVAEAEGEAASAFEARRKQEQDMSRLDILDRLANNPNIQIATAFENNMGLAPDNSLVTQIAQQGMEAFRMKLAELTAGSVGKLDMAKTMSGGLVRPIPQTMAPTK